MSDWSRDARLTRYRAWSENDEAIDMGAQQALAWCLDEISRLDGEHARVQAEAAAMRVGLMYASALYATGADMNAEGFEKIKNALATDLGKREAELARLTAEVVRACRNPDRELPLSVVRALDALDHFLGTKP